MADKIITDNCFRALPELISPNGLMPADLHPRRPLLQEFLYTQLN